MSSLGHHHQPTIPESRQPPSAMDFIGISGGCTICGTRSRPPHPPTRESFVRPGHHQPTIPESRRPPSSNGFHREFLRVYHSWHKTSSSTPPHFPTRESFVRSVTDR
ncbi:hypothetical protein CDAR_503241 [Caerostris darwini]|uniref:Uncharacterized protein n=1 Tax=Caerostris darwini TaxID=1538125 RepID=A0AAV4V1R8_9ARAC|nr:hypothetical protein CDAR_503241 [Caerostris darwini]